MGVMTVKPHSRYMGFPILFGRSNKVIFSFVIDRIWNKVQNNLRVRNETLIKAVVRAMPNYITSCNKMPEGCFHEIYYARKVPVRIK